MNNSINPIKTIPALLCVFLLSTNSCTDKHKNDLEIIQQSHAWQLKSGPNQSALPVKIEVYLKNPTNTRITAKRPFVIELDGSGIEKNFIDDVVKIFGVDNLATDNLSSRGEAITRYINRGYQVPKGYSYEPVPGKSGIVFTTTIYAEIDLNPGETRRFELEADIPPIHMGFLLKMK